MVWGPRAAAAGWKYWAVLLPEELLGHSNVSRRVDVYGALGVTTRAFEDLDAAMQWLIAPVRSTERP